MTKSFHFKLRTPKQATFKRAFAHTGLTLKETGRLSVQETIAAANVFFEFPQPSTRLVRTMNSRDYMTFNSAQAGLDWLNG